jgi:hypothetical protein
MSGADIDLAAIKRVAKMTPEKVNLMFRNINTISKPTMIEI